MSDLAADYAAAGFGGSLPFGARPALLMVAVCNTYLDPASPLYAGVEAALAATLNAARIDCLLMTGFSTSGCVRATALDAPQHGFAPFVVREACGDRAPGPHQANLFDLQAKYAEVIDEAQALALIAGPRPA